MIPPIMKHTHGFSVVFLLALGFSGCASSQMNRIDRNRDIYETWPIETRQAVLDGKVEPGMNPDMVRVAWGEPSEIVTQSANGDEIWVYKKGGNDGSIYYPGGPQYPASMGGAGIGGVGVGGPGIGISTGRGGTAIGATGGIGIGSGGNIGMGSGIGGMGGGAIVTPPTPPEIREVVFRNGIVHRADKP